MIRLVAVLATALAVPLGAAGAQEPPVPAGALAGSVLDAESGLPVVGALVTLEPDPPALMVEPSTRMVVSARALSTGPSGAYLFRDVAPGRYRLRIERIGYRSMTLEVELRRPETVSVSVGLELDPVALEPVRAEGRAAALFQRAATAAAEVDEARAAAERHRQVLFLTSDARMLTYADVNDGVTLGEGDVFRALQRLPGVSTRDDYTAELWTRGAPWTQTRVLFDGIPLFNPVHALGILSAFTPEVLGEVFFHPGVPPARVSGSSAGVVDLRTRPAAGGGEWRGVLDFSLASTRVALERELPGHGGALIAARRSHLELLTRGLGRVGLDSADLPYLFQDIAGRVDAALGASAHLEASGLWEEDRLDGDVEGILERTDAHWGNAAARVTLRNRLGGVRLSTTAGASRFSAGSEERSLRVRDPAPSWTEPRTRNRIEHARLSGELAPASGAGAPRWAIGWDVVREMGSYDGPAPRYFAAEPDTVRRLLYERELTVAGLWAEATFALAPEVELGTGLRVEAGPAPANGGGVRAAPRVAVRWAPSPDQTLSLAAGRSWQYVQAIALAGPSIHPAFHASHFWLWADERTPAIRADVLTLGGERWLGHGWLASATAYARRAAGITTPDPTPGPATARGLFVSAESVARGVDIGLRRLGARWSASLGHSWGISELEAGGLRYPGPADRRHVLGAMAAVALPGRLRLAAAFTAMSGSPFTRAVSRSPGDCELFGFGCGTPLSLVQEANAERTPDYRSLDASLHWRRPLGRAELAAYVQVRNLTGRDNASTYSGTLAIGLEERRSGTEVIFEDRFEEGLPRLPLLGLRLTF